MHPLFILLVLIGLVFTIKWVKAQPAHKRQRAGFMAAIAAAGLVLLIALLTGKLNPLVAAVAAAIPMLQRLTHAKSLIEQLRSSVKGARPSDSNLVTSRLRVEVNHNNGKWTGEILRGRHQGRKLGALTFAQLSDLLSEYDREDSESAALLASYLEHMHGERYSARGSHASGGAATAMSQDEARQILGLDESASDEDVIATHRRLIQRMHPDKGGSGYLASKLNQAKRRLLNRG